MAGLLRVCVRGRGYRCDAEARGFKLVSGFCCGGSGGGGIGVCAADSVAKQREPRRRQDLHVVASIVEADDEHRNRNFAFVSKHVTTTFRYIHTAVHGYKKKKPPCPARPNHKRD